MIRACAGAPGRGRVPAEPERAPDLWHNMLAAHNDAPTAATYDAVILACARSGERAYVHEAFRLARQMVDAHRDARGRPALALRRQTICALLDGAKRIGDLRRVRALLAELVKRALCDREDEFEGQEEDLVVDEEVMTHVFHDTQRTSLPPKTLPRFSSVKSSAREVFKALFLLVF
jgi:hypothetical protein